jgi:hypothetical protein
MIVKVETKFDIGQTVYHKLKEGNEGKGIVDSIQVHIYPNTSVVQYFVYFADTDVWVAEKILQEAVNFK